MRCQNLVLLTTTLLASTAFSSPLASFEEIERRWINGESEAQIHANHHIREASPAWLVDRSADVTENEEFALATDRRTLERNGLTEKREASGILGAMKKFVNNFMESEGRAKLVTKRQDEEEAPILKPKKTMRYYFSA